MLLAEARNRHGSRDPHDNQRTRKLPTHLPEATWRGASGREGYADWGRARDVVEHEAGMFTQEIPRVDQIPHSDKSRR